MTHLSDIKLVVGHMPPVKFMESPWDLQGRAPRADRRLGPAWLRGARYQARCR